jgi:hypothetical protein
MDIFQAVMDITTWFGKKMVWMEFFYFMGWVFSTWQHKKYKIQWNSYKEFLWNKSAKVARFEETLKMIILSQ